VAPDATPLHRRLKEEGLIIVEVLEHASSFLETNIQPKLMTRKQLRAGAKWLLNNIYSPSAFAGRLEAFCDECDTGERVAAIVPPKASYRVLAKRLAAYGPQEQDLLTRMDRLAERRPELAGQVERALSYYCQARYLFEFGGLWDPSLAHEAAPLAA
jgi:hypothetical protein